jgi:aminoglycoside phosphotransferase (APT) family kinase protein
MDFVEGRVFRDLRLPGMLPAQRHEIYQAMVDIMAKLHQIDFRAVGLEDYGRVGGYMTRQLSRWTKQYEVTQTDDLPDI